MAVSGGAFVTYVGPIVTAAGSAVATAAPYVAAGSALYQLSQGSKGINVPPAPQTGATSDQSEVDAQQQQQRRQQAAGGLQSTLGTDGGQAGAILNPTNLGKKSLLGAGGQPGAAINPATLSSHSLLGG